MRIVSEEEFYHVLAEACREQRLGQFSCVTGPGRSGAVAAVYASHMLGIPFIPFGRDAPEKLIPLLIIDTATESGKTLRKAAKKYESTPHRTFALYDEADPEVGRVRFWYEAPRPQRFKHERPLTAK